MHGMKGSSEKRLNLGVDTPQRNVCGNSVMWDIAVLLTLARHTLGSDGSWRRHLHCGNLLHHTPCPVPALLAYTSASFLCFPAIFCPLCVFPYTALLQTKCQGKNIRDRRQAYRLKENRKREAGKKKSPNFT